MRRALLVLALLAGLLVAGGAAADLAAADPGDNPDYEWTSNTTVQWQNVSDGRIVWVVDGERGQASLYGYSGGPGGRAVFVGSVDDPSTTLNLTVSSGRPGYDNGEPGETDGAGYGAGSTALHTGSVVHAEAGGGGGGADRDQDVNFYNGGRGGYSVGPGALGGNESSPEGEPGPAFAGPDEGSEITFHEVNTTTGGSSSTDAHIWAYAGPSVDAVSPQDGAVYATGDEVELTADISDSAFDFADHYVQVEFIDESDGSVIGTANLSSAGTASTNWTVPSGSTDWTVRTTNAFGQVETSTQTLEATDDPIDLTNESPADGSFVDTASDTVELSIDVDSPYLERGDTHNVTFVDASDDSEIGNDTLTSPGTATTTWTIPESPEWYVVVEDEAGNQETAGPFRFEAARDMTILDETDQSVIDDREVRVQFYTRENDRVAARNTTNGTVPMSGLPARQDLVVELRADGYYPRRTIIRDVRDASRAYLLDNSTEAVEHRFVLDDFSGRFSPGDSILQIDRAIEDEDGEQRFQLVAGDGFGAANEIVVTVQSDQRYRLRIRNDQDELRTLGDWRAESAGTTRLEVGQIEWSTERETYRWTTSYQNTTVSGEDPTGEIAVDYRDPTGQTDEFHLTIHEHGNESNVLFEQQYFSDANNVSERIAVHGSETETTWRVEWTAERAGETIEDSRTVGDHLDLDDNPLPEEWALIGVGLVLLFVAFLFGGIYSGIGAVIVSLLAAGLWWFGWLPLPAWVVLGAAFVAVVWVLGGERP